MDPNFHVDKTISKFWETKNSQIPQINLSDPNYLTFSVFPTSYTNDHNIPLYLDVKKKFLQMCGKEVLTIYNALPKKENYKVQFEKLGVMDARSLHASVSRESKLSRTIMEWQTNHFLRNKTIMLQRILFSPDYEPLSKETLIKLKVENMKEMKQVWKSRKDTAPLAESEKDVYVCCWLQSYADLFAAECILYSGRGYEYFILDDCILICDIAIAKAIRDQHIFASKEEETIEASSVTELQTLCAVVEKCNYQFHGINPGDWLSHLELHNPTAPNRPFRTVRQSLQGAYEKIAVFTVYAPCTDTLPVTLSAPVSVNPNIQFVHLQTGDILQPPAPWARRRPEVISNIQKSYRLQAGHGCKYPLLVRDAMEVLKQELNSSNSIFTLSKQEYSWTGMGYCYKPVYKRKETKVLVKGHPVFFSHSPSQWYHKLALDSSTNPFLYISDEYANMWPLQVIIRNLLALNGIDPDTITEKDLDMIVLGSASVEEPSSATTSSNTSTGNAQPQLSEQFTKLHNQFMRVMMSVDYVLVGEQYMREVHNYLDQLLQLPWSPEEYELIASKTEQLATVPSAFAASSSFSHPYEADVVRLMGLLPMENLYTGYNTRSKLFNKWLRFVTERATSTFRTGDYLEEDSMFESKTLHLAKLALSMLDKLFTQREVDFDMLKSTVDLCWKHQYEELQIYLMLTKNVGAHGKVIDLLLHNFCILTYPATPHIAEYIWSMILKNPSSIFDHIYKTDSKLPPLVSLLKTEGFSTPKISKWNYVFNTFQRFIGHKHKERLRPTAVFIYVMQGYAPWEKECLKMLHKMYIEKPLGNFEKRHIAEQAKQLSGTLGMETRQLMAFLLEKYEAIQKLIAPSTGKSQYHKKPPTDEKTASEETKQKNLEIVAEVLMIDVKFNEMDVLLSYRSNFQQLFMTKDIEYYSIPSERLPPDPQERMALTKPLIPQVAFDFKRVRGRVQIIAEFGNSDNTTGSQGQIVLDNKKRSLIIVERQPPVHCIYQLDLSSSSVKVLAGTPGTPGHQDGSASSALFNTPVCAAYNSHGTLYIGEKNFKIRTITMKQSINERQEQTVEYTVSTYFQAESNRSTLHCMTFVNEIEENSGCEVEVLYAYADGKFYKIVNGSILSSFYSPSRASAQNITQMMPHPADPHRSLLICNFSSNIIERMVDCKKIFVVAGSSLRGYCDSSYARDAMMSYPIGFGASKRYMFIADFANSAIRLVDFVKGEMVTVSGVMPRSKKEVTYHMEGDADRVKWMFPSSVVFDEPNGVVYVKDKRTIRKITVKMFDNTFWTQIQEMQSSKQLTDIAFVH